MLSFICDYQEGANEEILERISATNYEKICGYGNDDICVEAKEKIKNACNCPEADVCFLVGGTQTNMTVIDSVLQKYEGVLSANTGHINAHESGAVEFTGHKILSLPNHEGKIDAGELADYLETFYADANHEHMIFPGMVYVSYPTEYGTLYSKPELESIHNICIEYGIPLFLDGARLGYGLASEGCDMDLEDIAHLTDIFYIGGTKVGALFGEAVVFSGWHMPKHFTTLIKQHGALLAKGWLLGIQFDTLFTNNLYMKNGKNAIETANVLRTAFKEKGYEIFIETVTNQIFVVLENQRMEELSKSVRFDFWEKKDETHTVVRFATSWATKMEDVNSLIKIL